MKCRVRIKSTNNNTRTVFGKYSRNVRCIFNTNLNEVRIASGQVHFNLSSQNVDNAIKASLGLDFGMTSLPARRETMFC